jgi:serine/threonine-protein kinase
MGVVFRGFDPAIGRPVAIKIIRTDAFATAEKQEELHRRFAREAGAAGRLLHPGIVTLFHYGQEGEYQYLVMELVHGESLDKLLAGRMPTDPIRGLDMVRQLAAALDYSHGCGVIHRDIKPANVLVGVDGQVKIVDFGVARVLSQTLTPTDVVLGTPAYMAPEQIMAHKVGAAADQFSLAVLAYQIFTGRRPFEGASSSEIVQRILHGEPVPLREANPSLPPSLMVVFQKALSKDPEDRYRSCTEFATEMRRALESPRVPSASTEGTTVDLNTARPNPAIRKALAGGAILAALAGAGLFFASHRGPAQAPTGVPSETTKPVKERRSVEVEATSPRLESASTDRRKLTVPVPSVQPAGGREGRGCATSKFGRRRGGDHRQLLHP